MKSFSVIASVIGLVITTSTVMASSFYDYSSRRVNNHVAQIAQPSSIGVSDTFIKAVDMWYKAPGVGSITGWNSKRGEVYSNGTNYYVKFYYGGGCTETVRKNPYYESSRSSSYRKSCQYMVSISTDLGTVELFFDF